MAPASTSQSSRLRCRPTNGTRASRPSAGTKSMALSMPTAASDLLTGIPSECRNSKLIAISPPRIGSSQLRKMAI